MKTIVTYFSATGTTQDVAKRLAKEIGADTFEIEPKQRYTQADLDWTNSSSRSTVEMKDKNSRPEIAKKPANIAGYDRVIIGFPVWWYTAPTIINTFLEENDLSGKEIFVFVTSGGSGADGSLANLKQAYPKLNFKKGARLGSRDTGKALTGWLD